MESNKNKTANIMQSEESKRITSPSIGSIVEYTGSKKPYDVYIVSGKYMANGRVSNYWFWRRVLKDGTISKRLEHGYGSFEESEKKYEISIYAKVIN